MLPLAAGAHPLVHLNAALNALATLLLLLGLWQIKRGRELPHGRVMLSALFVSAMFLTSYLTYHFAVQLTVRFTHPGPVKYAYYAILLSHVLLAVSVPFLAVAATIYGVRAVGWGRAAALPAEEKARNRAKHLESRPLGLSDLALRLGDRGGGLPDALSPLAVRRAESYTKDSSAQRFDPGLNRTAAPGSAAPAALGSAGGSTTRGVPCSSDSSTIIAHGLPTWPLAA